MAKATAVSVVPGAIVCADHEHTKELFELYTNAWEEQTQDAVTRGQSGLLRGRAASTPTPEHYGCVLIGPGTPLYVEEGNVVPLVHAKVRGVWIRGVTLPSMVSLDHGTPTPTMQAYIAAHAVEQAQLAPKEAKEASEGTFTVTLGDVSLSNAALKPYLQHIAWEVRKSWLPLLPESASEPKSKQGATIRVVLHPDGSIAAMKFDETSHDALVDRACWGAIVSVGQFQPLPEESSTADLAFQIRFGVNQRKP